MGSVWCTEWKEESPVYHRINADTVQVMSDNSPNINVIHQANPS